MLWTHRSLEAYCVTLWWRWGERWSVFFIFPSNGAPVEWNWQGKTEVLGGKTCPIVTLTTTNPTWTDPGSNPGRAPMLYLLFKVLNSSECPQIDGNRFFQNSFPYVIQWSYHSTVCNRVPDKLILWSIVVLEKLVVPELIKKCTAFYGKRKEISCSQERLPLLYPKSHASSLHLPSSF
jgi:hypothetical protein